MGSSRLYYIQVPESGNAYCPDDNRSNQDSSAGRQKHRIASLKMLLAGVVASSEMLPASHATMMSSKSGRRHERAQQLFPMFS
jgi:hypothetical protein